MQIFINFPLKTRLWKLILSLLVFVTIAPVTIAVENGQISLSVLIAHAGTVSSMLGIDALIQWILSWIGSLLISLAALLLTWSGSLFDVLLDWTIINFAAHMGVGTAEVTGLGIITGTGTGAVEIVWQVFRDLSNIAVIGMFIFVAISTILGIDEYGYKKFIANLLIVSILINFSMFFAKVSIDISNALAGAIYSSMKTTVAGKSGTTVSGTADAFLKATGATNDLTSLKTQQEALSKVADGSDSNFSILWVTMGLFIILTMLAAVLFYGSFLLLSRGILLIFLIASSSFAFASFMIPGLRQNNYGWKGWIDSLIRSALFAPLIMINLWMVLFIMNSVPAALKQNVGGFATAPGNPAAWTSLIVYLVGTGLLYISLNVAKSFSSNIAIMGSSFKAGDMVSGGIGKAFKGGGNAIGYLQSKRAYEKLNGEHGDNLRKDIAKNRSAGDFASAAVLEKKLAQLHTEASGKGGKFRNSPTLNKIPNLLSKASKIATEGAGKDGYAGTSADAKKKADEANEKKVKLAAPSEGEKKQVFETEVAAARQVEARKVEEAHTTKQVAEDEKIQLKDKIKVAEVREKNASLPVTERAKAAAEREGMQRDLGEVEQKIKSATTLTRMNAQERQSHIEKVSIDAGSQAVTKLTNERRDLAFSAIAAGDDGQIDSYKKAQLTKAFRERNKKKQLTDALAEATETTDKPKAGTPAASPSAPAATPLGI